MFAGVKNFVARINTLQSYRLLKNSVVYGIGDTIQRLLSVVMLPLYTRYLTPNDYGVIALLGIFGMIVGTVSLCGMTNGIGRYFYYVNQERTTISEVVWTAFLFVAAWSIVVVSTLSIFSKDVSQILFGSTEYTYLVVLTLAGIVVSNLSSIGRSILIFQEKSTSVVFLNITSLVVGIAAGVYLVVFLERGLAGAVEAGVIGSAIMCVPIVVLTMGQFEVAFSQSMLKKQLRFSLPLVAALVAFWFIDASDRYLLRMFLPLSEVGLYNIGYQIGLGMMLIVGGFTLSWPPYYHRNNQNDQGQSICNDVLKMYLLVASFFVVILSLGGPFVVRILTTESFYEAYTVVPLVAMAYMLKGPYIIFLIGVLVKDKASLQLYLEGLAAVVNVCLNLVLIPIIGREAAAITTLISYGIMALGAYLMVMQINPIPKLSVGYVVKLSTLTFFVAVSTIWVGNKSGYVLFSAILFTLFASVSVAVSYKEFLPLFREKLGYV